MKVVLASRNQGKLLELRRILAVAAPSVELLGLGDVPAYPEAPETGATFADNALDKAREAVSATGYAAVADDSGIAVDALNGMPGVLSARWSGPLKDDLENIQLVLHQVADVPDERLGASFVCAAALALPDGTERVVEGVMPGRIIRTPRGTNGFGYDPIFVPSDGGDLTTAELTDERKDAISHRGRAFRELATILATLT